MELRLRSKGSRRDEAASDAQIKLDRKDFIQYRDTMLVENEPRTPYDRLRQDILNGVFAPGDPLRLSALSARYKVSATPLREALSRLEEKRLVEASRNKGWRVAAVSLAQLEDIAAARLALERALLADSIRRGDVAWEAELVAAHHRLAQTPPPESPHADARRAGWIAAHDGFHRALLAAALSDRLRGFWAETLDQLQRYHDALLYRPGTLGRRHRPPGPEGFARLLAEVHSVEHHGLLKEAALSRDVESALRLLDEHVGHTLAVYRSVAGVPEGTDHQQERTTE
jgi:DNA-binding GntR family transcriptional regulator